MHVKAFIKNLLNDQRGATAVEYGLIIALIVIAIVSVLNEVADENTGIWAIVQKNVTAVM